MTCSCCARSVSKAITQLGDDARVRADPPSRKVNVQTSATPAALLKALDAAGFPAIAS